MLWIITAHSTTTHLSKQSSEPHSPSPRSRRQVTHSQLAVATTDSAVHAHKHAGLTLGQIKFRSAVPTSGLPKTSPGSSLLDPLMLIRQSVSTEVFDHISSLWELDARADLRELLQSSQPKCEQELIDILSDKGKRYWIVMFLH